RAVALAERRRRVRRIEQRLDVDLGERLRETRRALGRIEPERRVGFNFSFAQAVAVEALQGRDAPRGAGSAPASRREEREQVLLADLLERLFGKSRELLQVGAIGGDGVLRQPVLEPERVAERVEDRVYGWSSNAVAAASCIRSQRFASRR